MAPSQFDNLGSLTWIAPLYCPKCKREIVGDEVIMRPYFYDGYNWENPYHEACNTGLLGLPIDETERKIFINRRPERKVILELLDEGIKEITKL